MAKRARKPRAPKAVDSLTHGGARRPNLPSAEHQPLMPHDERAPVPVEWERRNPDLDPQLVWRGKAAQDELGLTVNAPPLYIQERIHPKALIDDLMKVSADHRAPDTGHQIDLFQDFNGLPSAEARTEFYRHHARWANRLILGDSLQVMASLAEREGLRGKVQCVYLDPPYGIRFNSNFQWSTTSRDVRDGKAEHITREPEQVRAFRDTWRDGIHSYLSYLRDRLIVARDLLADSGSIFVQIGDENVHRVRALMDEVFGPENLVSQIAFVKATGFSSNYLSNVTDHILWFAKDIQQTKYRELGRMKEAGDPGATAYKPVAQQPGNFQNFEPTRLAASADLTRQGASATSQRFSYQGTIRTPPATMHWATMVKGMERLDRAGRVFLVGNTLRYLRFLDDYPIVRFTNTWSDTVIAGFTADKAYVVQTLPKVIERCILMTTDPGDLVLDPTCGSGTTAYVAEQWGRRWITVDTSRVALALARARVMGGRFAWWRVKSGGAVESEEWRVESGDDGVASEEGRVESGGDGVASEEGRVESSEPPANHSPLSTNHDLRLGFEYERVPHIQLRDIANNAEIDVIWEERQPGVEAALARLNEALRGHATPYAVETGARAGQRVDFRAPEGRTVALPSGEAAPANGLLEWEVPREAPEDWPRAAAEALDALRAARRDRQSAIDESIARNAGYEELYDKPRADAGIVRVAGPFTVESATPHRTLTVDADGGFVDGVEEEREGWGQDFAQVMLEHLRTAGVQQAHRADRIAFSSLTPWPGRLVCAAGEYGEGEEGRRAGVFIGPEFGTVSRPDLAEAAREAAEAGFDALIACAFAYDAHSTEFERLGALPVLKARMNADLHMAGELKNTGKGNLFVIFGEPDVAVASEEWLVDSAGNDVAPWEILKLLSGIDRLAEVDGLDRGDLQAFAALSRRGEVWDYLADAAGGGVDSGEHRGGAGAADDGGVSAVAWRRARLAGGAGDLRELVRAAGPDAERGLRELVERLRRDQQNAERADAFALHSPLTTLHRTQVTVHGVDVYDPATGQVRSDGPDGIACWFIDTDYDGESFFVRHAYFLGAGDPYKALRTTLKAEIDADAWETLHRATSRPFAPPTTGRIAVKVINHLGDEVMKVYRVSGE